MPRNRNMCHWNVVAMKTSEALDLLQLGLGHRLRAKLCVHLVDLRTEDFSSLLPLELQPIDAKRVSQPVANLYKHGVNIRGCEQVVVDGKRLDGKMAVADALVAVELVLLADVVDLLEEGLLDAYVGQ